MSDRILILMWDDNGLESISDITAFEDESEAKMFAILAGEEPPDDSWPNLHAMRLRARYNTPRNYHIIGIKLPDDFTDEIIEKALEPNQPPELLCKTWNGEAWTYGENMTPVKKHLITHGINLNY